MATKKPVVKTEVKKEEPVVEVAESIEEVEVEVPVIQVVKKSDAEIRKEIEELMYRGKDAPMTDQIYGIATPIPKSPADILPEPNGLLQGVTDPLQRFINMYQPGEFVMRNNFRTHLLQILEDWRERFDPQKENEDE